MKYIGPGYPPGREFYLLFVLLSFHSNQTFLSLNCITGVTISIIVFFRRNFELILSKEYMDKYSSFEIFNSKWIHNSLAIIYIPRNRWRRLVYLPNFQATAGIYTVEIITRAPKLLSTHQPRQRCDQLWLEQIASRRKIRPSDWLAHVRWPDSCSLAVSSTSQTENRNVSHNGRLYRHYLDLY